MRKKPQSSKIAKDLNELKTQIKTFQESIGKSNDLIETVQEELKRMKETQQKSYSTVVGNETARQSTTKQNHITAQKLSIRIRGIQESSLKSPDERMHSDIENDEEVLEFLKIRDKRLAKIHTIGKPEAEKEGSRTVVFQMESEISRDLVIKLAHLWKNYDKKVFVSPELSQEDAKEENECLRKRRLLIKNYLFEIKSLRIRKLKLEQKKTQRKVGG